MHRISKDFQFESYTSHEDAQNLAKMNLDELVTGFTFWGTARSICRSLIFATCGTLKKNSFYNFNVIFLKSTL